MARFAVGSVRERMMTDLNPEHLRDAVIDAIAKIMAETGDDPHARRKAALAQFPNCPESVLRAADSEADEIREKAFLAPLASRFADEVAAREQAEAANRPALGARAPSMSSGGRSSYSHLDRDIPF